MLWGKKDDQYKKFVCVVVFFGSQEGDCDRGRPWCILLVVGNFGRGKEIDDMKIQLWNCHDGDYTFQI